MWSAKLLSSLFPTVDGSPLRAQRRPSTLPGKRRHAIERLEPRMLMAYNIVDLGGLSANALNDAGQVVGEFSGHAVTRQSGMLIDLGTLGGATSRANDINNAGQVVGYADTTSGTRHAFLITPEDTDGDSQADRWFRDDNANGINDLMLDLGTLGGPTSEARGINNSGQVVGRADTSTTAASYRAFLWESASGMQNLGTFGATTSDANDINDGGQVVGTAASFIGSTIYNGSQGFRWDPVSGGSLLASFYGTPRKATGINEAGQIVGHSGYVQSYGPLSRVVYWTDAFLWQDGGFTSLGFASPQPSTTPFDVSINNHGQVAGLSYLWEEGTRTDLNSLVDPSLGWTISTASDIDDAGQVLGRGTHNGVLSSLLLSYGVSSQPPTLSIRDINVTEGDGGSTSAVFTVSLSRPIDETVTVEFSTANGTAIAGSDYVASSGIVTFAPGEIGKSITVPVNGDFRDEYDETLVVNLASATNAVLADSQAMGTILDNDLPPTLGISDVTVVEGNSGVTYVEFTVTLSAATDKTISMNYATSNGTASAGSDYQAASGTLIFNPGETVKTIRIAIYGDRKKENDETFYLHLLGSFNGADLNPVDMLGIATIKNDDR